MKIYVANYISLIQHTGGISRFVKKLILDLKRQNSHGRYFFEEFIKNKVKDPNRSKVKSRILTAVFFVFRVFNVWCFKPDLIHDTYPTRLSFSFSTKKTLITVYDCMPEIFSDQFSEKVIKQRRHFITRAFHIHAISNATKRDIIRIFGVPEKKITVVYLNDMRSKKKEMVTRSFEEKKRVLFVGNRTGYKNFVGAVKIFKLMLEIEPTLKFVIFGGGKLRIAEKVMLNNLGLSQKSYEHVFGSDEKLDKQFSQARLLLYTSLYEGFGLPVLESINSNCPVIVTDSSSLKEVMPIDNYRLKDYDEHTVKQVLPFYLKKDLWTKTLLEQKKSIKYFNDYDTAKELSKLYEYLKYK